jgi:DNA-binding LacI/PurR family transcriptional regulator
MQLQSIPSRQKIQGVCQSINRLADELGPGAKLPTVRKMCQQLQISVATLNDALRVLEDQRVITRRQGSGVFVSESVHHKTIGLVFGTNIFDGIVSPFYAQLIEHCRQRAAMHREQFRFFLDVPQLYGYEDQIPVHNDLEDAVMRKQLDGVLLVAHRKDQKQWLLDHHVPVVELGGDEDIDTPSDTYIQIIKKGVRELVRLGSKRIAMITPLGERRGGSIPDYQDDLTTFGKIMKQHGLPVGPNAIWQNIHSADASGKTEPRGDQGWRAMHELWRQPRSQRPDALLILDDMLTLGMLSAMPVLGIQLNQDLFIATHANAGSPALHHYEEHLIRLEVDPGQFIDYMFDKLHAILERNPFPKSKSNSLVVHVPDSIRARS